MFLLKLCDHGMNKPKWQMDLVVMIIQLVLPGSIVEFGYLCSVCSKRIFFKAGCQQASSMINCLGFSKHRRHLIAPKEVIVHIKLVLTLLVSISVSHIPWKLLSYGFDCSHHHTRNS